MKKKDLLAHVPSKKPNKKAVVADIFTVDRRPVLELTWIDTISMEPHLIRHFVWRGHWLTYRGKRAYGEAVWTKEQYETALYGKYYMYGTADESKAQETVQAFLASINAGMQRIGSYERMLTWERQDAATSRKQKRITARVNEITPPLPKGFIRWAKEQKAKYAYLLQWNGRQTVDRRFEIDHREDGTIVTEFVRGFSYTAGQSWDEYYYGENYAGHGREQKFWDKKRWNAPCDRKGLLYPNTLREIPWESENAYRAVLEDAKNKVLANYGLTYRRYQTDDRAERIVKSGYKNLADLWRKGYRGLFYQVGPREGVDRMLGVTKGRYRFLRGMNAGAAVIEAAQMGTDDKPRFSEKELAMLHKVPGEARKKSIVGIADRKRIPISHVIKLLGGETAEGIKKYYDYLDMAEELGEDIHDEIIYRNKRWREYHDRHVAELEKVKADKRKKEVDSKYRRIRSKAAANEALFGWQTKGYLVMVPERASDIVTEGRLQHHCVGASDTYIENMNEGRSFIVFLRKEEQPETPFYTIEVTPDGTIQQAYAAYDRKPDWDEVKKVLDKWKREVRKRTEEAV